MLTFEKILKVFQAYLDDDPLYEVVQTSHGYTLMAWEPHRNDWYSAEIQKTPEDLRNALLGTYANFLEDKITGNDRDLTATETAEIQQRRRECALRRNNNLPYEVSRPTFRRSLSMSYSPFRTSTEYIIVLFLEQCKKRNVNYKLQPTCI